MKIEISRLGDNVVIHSGDFGSVRGCLEDGVKKNISFYHDDTDGNIATSAGNLVLNSVGADIQIVNGKILKVFSDGNDKWGS